MIYSNVPVHRLFFPGNSKNAPPHFAAAGNRNGITPFTHYYSPKSFYSAAGDIPCFDPSPMFVIRYSIDIKVRN
jgi:hypothetical protein